jgi:hypothetical protein
MIYNIPDKMWLRVQDSISDIVYAGYYDTGTEAKKLFNMKLGFLKHACVGKFKIRLHTSRNFNRVYAESNTIDFANIKESIFTGQVKFDFDGINLNKNTRYYVTILASDYTRVGDTNFVGWHHDGEFTTNVSSGNWPNEFPIRMEFFVK